MGTPENNNTDSLNNEGKPENSSIDYEKRYKDTQASYTKSQQELKATQAKLEALEKLTQPRVELTPEVQTELDDLKYSDPEAWRVRMNSLEKDAVNKHAEMLNLASQEALKVSELERRAQVLADFNASHGIEITDELIQYDVPPRITKKLETGEVDFETFLTEVADYLKAPKVVGSGNRVLGQPNIGSTGGDSTPTKNASEKDFRDVYKTLVY